MKKCMLLVSLLFLFASCAGKNDYIGTWSGNVLIVDVVYTFTQKSFEVKTLSFNNILIGGKRGKITKTENGVLHLRETESYFFNAETNRGGWQPSADSYTFKYSVNGKKMTLSPSYAENPLLKVIELEKKQ